MISRLSISALLLFCFCACKKGESFDCFRSNGKQATELRSPGSFSVITVSDKIDLNIVQGNSYEVEVTAGKHLLSKITTTVENGILDIHATSTCNFVRGYKQKTSVKVTVPFVSRVENLGVGDVRFDTAFSQDSVKVMSENSGDIYLSGTYRSIATSSHGNGDVYLGGSCQNMNIFMYGTNFLYAGDFKVSGSIFVETLSIGDCFVNASAANTLSFRVWRNGNIYYKGHPAQLSGDYEESCKGRAIRQD